jgi:protein tyrosine/serine phosphatase
MNGYQNKIINMGGIIIGVVTIFILTSGAPLYAVSGQEASQIVKVSEGIYRGPRLDNLNELESLKIHTILNLEDNNEAIQKESEAAEQLGIVMINIPMSEISRPGPSDLVRAVKILEDPDSHPVYVHCLRGRDRTGFVIAAYEIIHQGWTLEKAYQEAVDNGHNTWFYELILGWKKSLQFIANGKPSVQAAP